MASRQHETQTNDNGLAIASLVLGILSLTALGPFTGIPAVITGAIGLKNPTNKGMSLAGLIMGSISVLLTILFVVFIMFLIMIGAFSSSPNSTPNHSDYYDQPNTSVRQRI